MEYIERAFIDAREGRPAARPFSGGVIPTAFDKTLAPEGYHIMSLFTQWVPSTWSAEPHREELERYADRVVDAYNEVAPNFKAAILHRDVIGPCDMEHDYGLIGGNIFHGELSLEQLFHLRPAPGYADYRTPAPGLYYASSATHAGGGVCGIPGMQAARAATAATRAPAAAKRISKPGTPSPCPRTRSASPPRPPWHSMTTVPRPRASASSPLRLAAWTARGRAVAPRADVPGAPYPAAQASPCRAAPARIGIPWGAPGRPPRHPGAVAPSRAAGGPHGRPARSYHG